MFCRQRTLTTAWIPGNPWTVSQSRRVPRLAPLYKFDDTGLGYRSWISVPKSIYPLWRPATVADPASFHVRFPCQVPMSGSHVRFPCQVPMSGPHVRRRRRGQSSLATAVNSGREPSVGDWGDRLPLPPGATPTRDADSIFLMLVCSPRPTGRGGRLRLCQAAGRRTSSRRRSSPSSARCACLPCAGRRSAGAHPRGLIPPRRPRRE
jgi:hypothetical protein